MYRDAQRGDVMDTHGTPERCTVLIVEDSTTLRQMVSMALESRGYRVRGAADGITALHSLSEHLPDAILLDLNLPDIDGFELCKRMKSEPRSRNIPVLVMTGLDQPGFEIMAIEAGADDFIAKPVDPLVLDARIEMVVRRMRRERFANALTGLPGNALTEERLAFGLARRKPFAVVFVDINGFRPFNRRYGYARGDLLLRHLAELILESLRFSGCEEPFVGHLGGDDFVVTCEPECAESVAHEITKAFDLSVMDFYEDEDRDRGFFVLANRSGDVREYGPLSLSAAIVPVIESYPDSVITLIDAGMELLGYAREQGEGSTVVSERRAEPGPR
ncbi:MAG: response regulator [Actinobacteria bacterium]|nr:response regulator [Actinomycetota bacterium]